MMMMMCIETFIATKYWDGSDLDTPIEYQGGVIYPIFIDDVYFNYHKYFTYYHNDEEFTFKE